MRRRSTARLLSTPQQIEALQFNEINGRGNVAHVPPAASTHRRAVDDDSLPAARMPDSEDLSDDPRNADVEVQMQRASDVFIAVYSIHRSPRYWPEPDKFDPHRWLKPYKNPDEPNWAGYDPDKWMGVVIGTLYPTETASDFAYLPFGGGARKCVGDQFAMMEATVALAGFVNRHFEFAGKTYVISDKVGINDGRHWSTRRKAALDEGDRAEQRRGSLDPSPRRVSSVLDFRISQHTWAVP